MHRPFANDHKGENTIREELCDCHFIARLWSPNGAGKEESSNSYRCKKDHKLLFFR